MDHIAPELPYFILVKSKRQRALCANDGASHLTLPQRSASYTVSAISCWAVSGPSGERAPQPGRRRRPPRASQQRGQTPSLQSSGGRRGQRLRLRPRRPRRLPLLLNILGGGGRLPSPKGLGANGAPDGWKGRNPPGRAGRSSAALTLSFRPPSSRPLKTRIASAASASLENSTKAKPRGRPVSRSVGR